MARTADLVSGKITQQGEMLAGVLKSPGEAWEIVHLWTKVNFGGHG